MLVREYVVGRGVRKGVLVKSNRLEGVKKKDGVGKFEYGWNILFGL